VNALAELFPDEEHRFRLALRRGDAAAFFARTAAAPHLLAERNHWLDTDPGRHAALRPEGESLRAAFAALAGEPADATVTDLGRWLEPDFLLLAPDPSGEHVLLGGALCFPTGWALTAQLGRPLEAIHGVVPGLNAALAGAIRRFMAGLRPGDAFLRANWGLAATAELNLHPELGRPRLAPPFDPARVWLRVEHQLLAGLTAEGGLLFGIRVECHPLEEAVGDPAVRTGLGRALQSMSAAVAAYKGIEPVRTELLRWLER
jgi:hypothetical protein